MRIFFSALICMVGFVMHAGAQSPLTTEPRFHQFQLERDNPFKVHYLQHIPKEQNRFVGETGMRGVYDTVAIPETTINFTGNVIVTLSRTITNTDSVPVTFAWAHMPKLKQDVYDFINSYVTAGPGDSVLRWRQQLLGTAERVKSPFRCVNNGLPWGGVWTSAEEFAEQADPVGNEYSIHSQSCGHNADRSVGMLSEIGFPLARLRLVFPPRHSTFEAMPDSTYEHQDNDVGTPFQSNGRSAMEIYLDTSVIAPGDIWKPEGLDFWEQDALDTYKAWLSEEPPTYQTSFYHVLNKGIRGWLTLPAGASLETNPMEVIYLDSAQENTKGFLAYLDSAGSVFMSGGCDPGCQTALIDSAVTLAHQLIPSKTRDYVQSALFGTGFVIYGSDVDQGKPLNLWFAREQQPPTWKLTCTLADTLRLGDSTLYMPFFLVGANQPCVIGDTAILAPATFNLWSSADTSPICAPTETNYVTEGMLYPGYSELFVAVNENPYALSRIREWTLIGKGLNGLVIEEGSSAEKLTGMANVSPNEKLNVYPNPARDRLYVPCDGTLYSLEGRSMETLKEGWNYLALPSGMYIFTTSKSYQRTKVVID